MNAVTNAENLQAAPQSGAEVLLRALRDQGVEVIFGYPGGAVLPIYDALFQQNSIRHILVRHEQAAVHAAEGYARSTGRVGVVLVTSGPGATNAVTGLVDALMDSVPVVCLTGQVPTHLIGNDAFQEADTHRHHPARNQAQLPRQAQRRAGAHGVTMRSTWHAAAAPVPVRGGSAEGHPDRTCGVRAARPRKSAPQLPAGDRSPNPAAIDAAVRALKRARSARSCMPAAA